MIRYLKDIFLGFYSLWQGMSLTLYNFTRPWKTIITEQYPENRKKGIRIPERFNGKVYMPHDADNMHKCTACKLCELACPNFSIKITTLQEELPEGKTRKILDKWGYNLGSCTMCAQCVEACPQDAIQMVNEFELSMYSRQKLIYHLNFPGSKLKEKEKTK